VEAASVPSGTDHDILLSKLNPPSILEQMTPTH
jgi:hypothetical protein